MSVSKAGRVIQPPSYSLLDHQGGNRPVAVASRPRRCAGGTIQVHLYTGIVRPVLARP